ncbi:MAG: type IV pilus twitching motility protein PilT [Desulfosporosinus sp.]|jgi:twitching motility protein PilT
MLSLEELLRYAGEQRASDIHLTVESPPVLRIDGSIVKLQMEKLSQADLETFTHSLMDTQQFKRFTDCGEIDLAYSIPGIGRYRVNAFQQRGSTSFVIRSISFVIPSPESLGLPPAIIDLASLSKGLVLVVGPSGNGKSTTLASLIDYINRTRACHIVTIEDPIEYLHDHNLSLVNQREVGSDTRSFTYALRSVLRQDPDVILVGEMRDLETIATTVTAAETGHLVFSTLHTNDAIQSIDRMIDVFPSHQQQQIRGQLANVLQGIISQQLLPRADHKGRVAAFEFLLATSAVRSLIREGKTYQLSTVIQTNAKLGMQTMDKAIMDLVQKGLITGEIAKEKLESQGSFRR